MGATTSGAGASIIARRGLVIIKHALGFKLSWTQ